MEKLNYKLHTNGHRYPEGVDDLTMVRVVFESGDWDMDEACVFDWIEVYQYVIIGEE